MRAARLLSMRLRNFMSAVDQTIEFDGKNFLIFGQNEAGKTTINTAFNWVLFDKDSEYKSQWQIKPTNSLGEEKRNVEVGVQLVFDLSGIRLELERTMTEDWKQKRGAATKEFAGHENLYRIDGVPVSKTEFQHRISRELLPLDDLMLLCGPLAFNEKLEWEDRRKLLLDICGDVSVEDVIAVNPELADVPDILGSRTLGDQLKVLDESRKRCNADIKQIPVRISELDRAIQEVGECPAIAPLQLKVDGLVEERSRVNIGTTPVELVNKLNDLKAKQGNAPRVSELALDATKTEREASEAAYKRFEILNREVETLEATLKIREREVESYEAQLVPLRRKFVTEEEKTFTGSDVCPTCGQDLPQSLIDKAIGEFNLAKSNTLTELNDAAQPLKAAKAASLKAVETLTGQIAEKTAERDAAKLAMEQAHAELTALVNAKREEIEAGHKAEAEKLETEIEETLRQMAETRVDNVDALNAIDNEIALARAALSNAQNVAAVIAANERSLVRKTELEAEQKELGLKFQAIERKIFQLENFISARVELLTDRINARFTLARWRLFKEQINGGLAECCDVTVNGIPWGKGLNDGAKINVGLECIDVLASHFGLAMPIFVDRAESVTTVKETIGQQIRLFATAESPTLQFRPLSLGLPVPALH